MERGQRVKGETTVHICAANLENIQNFLNCLCQNLKFQLKTQISAFRQLILSLCLSACYILGLFRLVSEISNPWISNACQLFQVYLPSDPLSQEDLGGLESPGNPMRKKGHMLMACFMYTCLTKNVVKINTYCTVQTKLLK